MNTTQITIQDQLWSSITPIIISAVSIILTTFVAYIQRKLQINTRTHRRQLDNLHEKHEELRQKVSQQSDNASNQSPEPNDNRT